ncbi:hypothetical protein WR25_13661 [Diploscapter pachys]|uniref:Ribosome-recycling factor, mitochondrial n=1 Tax=Diploscapter pachys TaxID=2018661 RepID=A0A2A2KRU8_9BILA|nr:hypothetical protein WR25_13661 [Diploscapter pachys]
MHGLPSTFFRAFHRSILLRHRSLSVASCSSTPSLVPTNFSTFNQLAKLHASAVQMKTKNKPEHKKKSPGSTPVTALTDEESGFVKACTKEMKSLEDILLDELTKHFSLQVDLRQYENLLVKTDGGDEHRMSHLGRVSLKTPHMVMINFADNPTVIKSAKLAIEKSALGVTSQQQGVVLYVPTPKMTRERREHMVHDAKKVYSKMDKKSSAANAAKPDLMKKVREAMLGLKKTFELKGAEHVETKQKELLTEVA